MSIEESSDGLPSLEAIETAASTEESLGSVGESEESAPESIYPIAAPVEIANPETLVYEGAPEGKVFQVTKKVYYEPDGQISSVEETSYDEQGRRLVFQESVGELTQRSFEHIYGEDGSHTVIEKKYDETGALMTRTECVKDSADRYMLYQEFDGDGKLVGSDTYEYNDSFSSVTTTCKWTNRDSYIQYEEYDENGELILRLNTDIGDGWENYRYEAGYDAQGNMLFSREYYNYELSERMEYVYDDLGREVECTCFQGDGSIEYRWESAYDDAGNLVKRAMYNGENQKTQLLQYEFDDLGNLISESRYGARVNYEYNEAGQLVKMYDGTTVTEYEYDDDQTLRREVTEYTQAGLQKITEYNEKGFVILELTNFQDGSHRDILQNNSLGQRYQEIGYTEDGEIWFWVKNEFDEYGNILKSYSYDSEGKVEYMITWEYALF